MSNISHTYYRQDEGAQYVKKKTGDTFYWQSDPLVFDMKACTAIGKHTVCLQVMSFVHKVHKYCECLCMQLHFLYVLKAETVSV